MASFAQRLESACRKQVSRLCLGLDPDPARMPKDLPRDAAGIESFLCRIIDATADHASVFKPNAAFFERLGDDGAAVLRRVIAHVHGSTAALVVLDAKRGDIGNTANAYAEAAFGHLGADAVTVAPYMGGDSLAPFAEDPERGAFVLARTSNPGARDFQELVVKVDAEGVAADDGDAVPLFLAVARRLRSWNEHGNLGLVAGATWPDDVRRLRDEVGPGLPFLLPGVGAQGGDVEAAVRAARDASGGGFIVNAGRSVLYASSGNDWADAAGQAALDLKTAIADVPS